MLQVLKQEWWCALCGIPLLPGHVYLPGKLKITDVLCVECGRTEEQKLLDEENSMTRERLNRPDNAMAAGRLKNRGELWCSECKAHINKHEYEKLVRDVYSKQPGPLLCWNCLKTPTETVQDIVCTCGVMRKSNEPCKIKGCQYYQEIKVSDVKPDWFKALDQSSQEAASEMAQPFVERYVTKISNCGYNYSIPIPKQWMVPDFAFRVLSICKRDGIEYVRTKETQDQIWVTGKQRIDNANQINLILITGEPKSGKTTLMNALDDTYDKYDNDTYDMNCKNIVRDLLSRSFSRNRHVAIILNESHTRTYNPYSYLDDIIELYKVNVIRVRT